jgi:hypothetical protein
MNRNTQAANPLDLQAQEIEELEYFKRNLSLKSGFVVSSGKSKDCKELSSKGAECFGLEALTRKIDQVFCKHIAQEWVPKELQKMKIQKAKVHDELKALGTDPAQLTMEEVLAATDEWLNATFFGRGEFSKICQNVQEFAACFCKDAIETAYDFCGQISADVDSHIMTVIRRRNVLQKISALIGSGSLVQRVQEIIIALLQSTFSKYAVSEPVRLNRFDAVLKLIVKGVEEELNKAAAHFQIETSARFERAYSNSFSSFLQSEQELTRHLLDSVVQWLIIPLFAVDGLGAMKSDYKHDAPISSKKRSRDLNSPSPSSSFTFTKLLHQQLSAVPAERDACKRAALASGIKACEAIEVELRSFGEKHGAPLTPMSNHNHAFVHVDD